MVDAFCDQTWQELDRVIPPFRGDLPEQMLVHLRRGYRRLVQEANRHVTDRECVEDAVGSRAHEGCHRQSHLVNRHLAEIDGRREATQFETAVAEFRHNIGSGLIDTSYADGEVVGGDDDAGSRMTVDDGPTFDQHVSRIHCRPWQGQIDKPTDLREY